MARKKYRCHVGSDHKGLEAPAGNTARDGGVGDATAQKARSGEQTVSFDGSERGASAEDEADAKAKQMRSERKVSRTRFPWTDDKRGCLRRSRNHRSTSNAVPVDCPRADFSARCIIALYLEATEGKRLKVLL